MWKRFVIGLAVFGVLCLIGIVAATAYFGVKTLAPEKVDKGLQTELAALGVVLGKSTRAEAEARFGAPEQERQETLSIVLSYPSKGLLLRVGKQSGVVEWLEYTSPQFATAKGIKVGAPYQALVDTYGLPSSTTPFGHGARVRYQFGMAYILEFSLDKDNRVNRIALFKA